MRKQVVKIERIILIAMDQSWFYKTDIALNFRSQSGFSDPMEIHTFMKKGYVRHCQ